MALAVAFAYFIRQMSKLPENHPVRYVFGQTFDAIARQRGLLLTTDLIHANNTGAGIIADQIAVFLLTA